MTPKENTKRLIKKWSAKQAKVNRCNQNNDMYLWKSTQSLLKWERRFKLLPIMKQARFDNEGKCINLETKGFSENYIRKIDPIWNLILDDYRIIQPTPAPEFVPKLPELFNDDEIEWDSLTDKQRLQCISLLNPIAGFHLQLFTLNKEWVDSSYGDNIAKLTDELSRGICVFSRYRVVPSSAPMKELKPEFVPYTFKDREEFRELWIRNKHSGIETRITIIERPHVKVCNNYYRPEDLFKEWERLDGTPFGKKVQ